MGFWYDPIAKMKSIFKNIIKEPKSILNLVMVAGTIFLISFLFPKNGKIDVPFNEQDLQISLTEITGIPFTWSTEVQVRIWD